MTVTLRQDECVAGTSRQDDFAYAIDCLQYSTNLFDESSSDDEYYSVSKSTNSKEKILNRVPDEFFSRVENVNIYSPKSRKSSLNKVFTSKDSDDLKKNAKHIVTEVFQVNNS